MSAFGVVLEERLLVGRGAHRSTYLHPDDTSKVIKVVHDGGQQRSRNRKRFWSMGRRLDMDGNERELQTVRLLQGIDRYDMRFFPVFFGSITTNLGQGLIFENFGSGPGEHISELKNSAQLEMALQLLSKEKILEQFDELLRFFLKVGIPTVSLSNENLGILDRPGQPPQLVCFDIKYQEDRCLIPAAEWFSSVHNRRIERLLKRRRVKFSAMLNGEL